MIMLSTPTTAFFVEIGRTGFIPILLNHNPTSDSV